MRGFMKLILTLALVALCAASTFAATKYVVTNDDIPSANTATFYTVGTGGKLTLKKTVATGGTGLGGGFFADARVNVSHSKTQPCVYVSNATSNNISAISEATLTRTRTLQGRRERSRQRRRHYRGFNQNVGLRRLQWRLGRRRHWQHRDLPGTGWLQTEVCEIDPCTRFGPGHFRHRATNWHGRHSRWQDHGCRVR